MLKSVVHLLCIAALVAVIPVDAQSDLFVVTSDFETGSIAHLQTGATVADTDLLTIHSDALARYYDGRVYVINRLGQDNVLVLDVGDLRTPITQFSVGNGSNPQDIAFAGPGKAYVSRYASSLLLIVDPRDGTELGEIDLSSFADEDGTPEMGQMVIAGNFLYVACQRLDRNGSFEPVEPSLLVVIDTSTDTVVDMNAGQQGVQAWELSATNPNSISVAGDELFVGLTGSFGDVSGGVEVLNLSDRTTRGLVVGEAALGGDLTWLELVSNKKGFVIVSDADFLNHIKPIDLARGEVGEALSEHSKGFAQNLAVDGSRLIVPDRGSFTNPESAGLLIYDANTDILLEGPIPVGLPPLRVTVLGERQITAVLKQTSESVPEKFSLAEPFPNPFNSEVTIRFTLSEPESNVRLVVYDSLGQVVKTLARGDVQSGFYQTSWDGRDEAGQISGTGAYFVVLNAGDRQIEQKIVFAK